MNQHQLQSPFHLWRKWPLSLAELTHRAVPRCRALGRQSPVQGVDCYGENTQGLFVSERGCASRVGEAFDPELGNSNTRSGSEGAQLSVGACSWPQILPPPTEVLTFSWLPPHPVPIPGTPVEVAVDAGSPDTKVEGRRVSSEV